MLFAQTRQSTCTMLVCPPTHMSLQLMVRIALSRRMFGVYLPPDTDHYPEYLKSENSWPCTVGTATIPSMRFTCPQWDSTRGSAVNQKGISKVITWFLENAVAYDKKLLPTLAVMFDGGLKARVTQRFETMRGDRRKLIQRLAGGDQPAEWKSQTRPTGISKFLYTPAENNG